MSDVKPPARPGLNLTVTVTSAQKAAIDAIMESQQLKKSTTVRMLLDQALKTETITSAASREAMGAATHMATRCVLLLNLWIQAYADRVGYGSPEMRNMSAELSKLLGVAEHH